MLPKDFELRMKEYLKDEYDLFLKSFDDPNIRAFNINTNYINKEDFINTFNHEIKEIPYLNNSFYLLENDTKMGYHPLHHAGAIYMQDPGAMMPVNSIDIPSDAFVLDLCSAPGGKAIQMALKVRDGAVISNEIDRERSKILYSNIERMGFNNVVVTNNKPSDFLPYFKGAFDVIVVDAPCSGEGMFRKYPNAIDEWSLDNVNVCHNRDIEILDIAIQLLKKNGILIYSTCTYAKEENEDIISYLIDNYGFSLLDINDNLKPYLKEGFIPNTYRFYPHIANGEGQFLAVLQNNNGVDFNSLRQIKKYDKVNEFSEFCDKYLTKPITNIIKRNNDIYYSCIPYESNGLKVLNYGVKLGEIYNKRFVPNHNMFKSFSSYFKSNLYLDCNDPLVSKYLHGEQIQADVLDGFGVIFINNIPLGGYKASRGLLNNYYPKGLRNF
jgi:16S rRNA C967 or C1407 C5-methylase (RsmB/RsmF family)/NOL1/NOP2/fmu family ribosome biogenesis protein